MTLISRFRNVFRSKANAILDRIEDPEEQLDYLYEQLQEQRKLAARAIRDATADRNMIRNELDDQREAMQKAHGSAKAYRAKALQLEGDGAAEDQVGRYNDAAKRLLAEFLKHQKRVEELETNLEKATLSVNTLKEKQIDLDTKVDDLRSRKEQLKSQWRMAKAEERLSSSLAGFEGDFSDMDLTLGRIEQKVKRKKALAQASTEVLAEQQSEQATDLPPLGTDAEAAWDKLGEEVSRALPSAHTAYFCIAISGGGTWALDEARRDELLSKLNEVDNELNGLNERGQLSEEKFAALYPELFALIRREGKLVGRDLTPEDAGEAYHNPEIKLPPEDLEFEEAHQLFEGEGLLPG